MLLEDSKRIEREKKELAELKKIKDDAIIKKSVISDDNDEKGENHVKEKVQSSVSKNKFRR
jgi:hypothetical protein